MACDQGVYEHDNVRTLFSLMRPNTTYFDVGANIGLLSIPVLYQEPTSKVVSIEPSPNAAPFLRKTIQNSRYGDRWVLVEKAAGDTVGETFFSISSPALGAFDGVKDTQRAKVIKEIKVPVTTLDHEWEILGNPKISVIKVDVEGAELEVLRGGLECIAKEKPYILVEWNLSNLNAYEYGAESLLVFAQSTNYCLFSIPHLLPVTDITTLKIQMLKTESFLLAPSESGPKRNKSL